MAIGKSSAFVMVEKEETVQRDKQNYDRLRATDGDNDLDSSSPSIDMMRHDCNCQEQKQRILQ